MPSSSPVSRAASRARSRPSRIPTTSSRRSRPRTSASFPTAASRKALPACPASPRNASMAEASQISIRGLSPDFAGTTLNGREQATIGENRGVDFDQYPSELISGAAVYKTPGAPASSARSLSGTVDLHTIKPLDLPKRTFAANLRGENTSNGSLNHGTGVGDTGHRARLLLYRPVPRPHARSRRGLCAAGFARAGKAVPGMVVEPQQRFTGRRDELGCAAHARHARQRPFAGRHAVACEVGRTSCATAS